MSTPLPFLKQLEARARAVDSLLCVGLDPHPDLLPENTAKAAYEFCKRIIDQTHDLACAFKPNSAFFEALGGAGFDALRDVIAYIRQVDPSIPVILDAKRGDISSTADAYARAAFEVLGASAITLSPYLGLDSVAPFLKYPGKGAFILVRTSNPGADEFQDQFVEMQGHTQHLYSVVAEHVKNWSTGDNLGLVVGATHMAPIISIRGKSPDAWMLVPGVGAQGGELFSVLWDGLREDGLGILINASRSIAKAEEPRQEAQRLRSEINFIRQRRQTRAVLPSAHFLKLLWAVQSAGCVKIGTFKLKSGSESPIYIDMRRLVATPGLLRVVAEALATRIETLGDFDHLAGIPYAALPIVTITAQVMQRSLVYPRREAKTYGTKAHVEGVFKSGDVVVLIDDLATTGDSKIEAIDKLKDAGLIVRDIVVVIDREQGAKETLEKAGYRFHALLTITQILDELERLGQITTEKRQEVNAYLKR